MNNFFVGVKNGLIAVLPFWVCVFVVIFCAASAGCSIVDQAECEEHWRKMYNAKGQVLYIKENSSCVQITYKEPYSG